ncbi:MAG: hypothetical protein RR752_04175, partial [Mucinivorans sp.]
MRNLILVSVVLWFSSLMGYAAVSDSIAMAAAHEKDSIAQLRIADSIALDRASSLQRLDFTLPGKTYIIRNLAAIGLTSINAELLISTTGLAVGDSIVIPGEVLSDATRRLWDQRNFSDVKVSTDFRGDSV